MQGFPRTLLFLGTLAASAGAPAATLEWPGAAPCNGTLQACVDAAANGDTVLVVAETTISGGVSLLNKSLELRAAPGLRPAFAAGTSVSAAGSGAGPMTVTVQGFALFDARIDLSWSGTGAATFGVYDNRITASSASVQAGVRVRNFSGGTSSVQVENNRITAGIPFINASLLQVSAAGGSVTGKILHNRIEALPSAESGWGIVLDATGGSNMGLAVAFNEVRGRFGRGGIGATEGLFSSTASTLVADVFSNVVVCGARMGQGFTATLNNGNIDADVVNNTIVGCNTGVGYSRWFGSVLTGTIDGLLNSNILAHNQRGMQLNPEFFANITEADNLFWDNGSNQPAPTAGSSTADPLFLSAQHPYLKAGSPAINNGNLFTPLLHTGAGLPALDAGGLRRLRGAQVDIGAHEFGDTTLLHTGTSGNVAGHITTITGAPFDGTPGAKLFATPNYDGGFGPEGPAVGTPLGVYFAGGLWRIFNQDFAPMPVGARFNVFAPQPGNGVFTHVSTAANISAWSSQIDNSSLNGQPDRFVLVTQDWTAGGAAQYNAHPVGVFYFGFGGPGSWFVTNLDQTPGVDMAANLGFSVYSQDRSPNAFVAEATPTTAAGQALILRHPLLDETPCAQLQVTRQLGSSPAVNHFDVRYNQGTGRWFILNQNAPMPAGARFFVLVDPRQVTLCVGPLFRDGFE